MLPHWHPTPQQAVSAVIRALLALLLSIPLVPVAFAFHRSSVGIVPRNSWSNSVPTCSAVRRGFNRHHHHQGAPSNCYKQQQQQQLKTMPTRERDDHIIRIGCTSLYAGTNWWETHGESEAQDVEVIVQSNPGYEYYDEKGTTLFDAIYRMDDADRESQQQRSSSGLARYSLRDISESYYFSLSYLGDYVIQLGAQPPIDIDAEIGSYLSGEQVYAIMEAINTLDPVDSNIDYDSVTARELAEDLEISYSRILSICERERFNLPFGLDSTLHRAVAEKITEVSSYEDHEYDGDTNYGDPDDAIDVEVV